MKKVLRIRPEQIQPLATNCGGCIASDRITVDGQRVGYMYRDKPHSELDRGWRFLAGDESPEYMDDSTKHEVYDINTIANYDPTIIPLLDAQQGVAFERDPDTLELRLVEE